MNALLQRRGRSIRGMFGLMVLAVVWAIMPATQAQGIIVPWVETNPDWLTIDFHHVDVSIHQQVAQTRVSLQFTNTGSGLAEGTFLFPLPSGAAVQTLTMTIDDMVIEANILRAEEARRIYDEIVRQYRDPALLEYVGQDLIQANVFPIPPGESRKIDIQYGQLLTAENGLFKYVYPLHTGGAVREVISMQMSVRVTGEQAISNVYSPSHAIAVSRPNDFEFVAGFEQSRFVAGDDFTLYYGVGDEAIGMNLLSYRESAGEDGFFLLMVQPPLVSDDTEIQAKDVVIVLDQSGSMFGEKWTQAQEAALYVLERLNPRDRFNVIAFSTGWRVYGRGLLPASEVADAKNWVRGLEAGGMTDIYGALSTALSLTDNERPLTVLFLTDGLATEGVTDTQEILSRLADEAPPSARIFSFGVGYDVDTFLLDQLVADFRGAGVYVRPHERIDEAVASLYNKISSPVMTDIELIWEGISPELVYPQALADLFAGEQLTLVGRYRHSDDVITVTLKGDVDGERQTLVYTFDGFSDRAGGEHFLGRLWAMRRIGDLLNRIRLQGEHEELVESVVSLSIRYGIITPYTSFLIEEDDILSQRGRASAMDAFADEAEALALDFTGERAVDAAQTAQTFSQAAVPLPAPTSTGSGRGSLATSPAIGDADAVEMEEALDDEVGGQRIRYVGDKTFLLQQGVWTDTSYQPDTMEVIEVVFLSDDYFDLLATHPEAGAYLALADEIIIVLDSQAYRVVLSGS